MTKYFAAKLVLVAFITASPAFAAPAARDSGDRQCAHCAMSGTAQSTVMTRGAPYRASAQPCRHQVAAVRWGVAQKPCPHCAHAA